MAPAMKDGMTNPATCVPDCEIHLCGEAIAGRGEDSYCFCYGEEAALLAVFDGCGGAGARRHPYYSNMSEAYMASRLCAGAAYDTYQELFPIPQGGGRAADPFIRRWELNCEDILRTYRPPRDDAAFAIKGSMVRTLPCTAAAVMIENGAMEERTVTAFWLGDSRSYLLTKDGLAQLTVDDTSVYDPMENLYKDGVLKRMLCADSTVQVHSATITVREPFAVLAATDGCFGYLSTPMEFEGAILGTLMSAKCAADWETQLSDILGKAAGDDYTLCLAAYGFPTFSKLKKHFSDRYDRLQKQYLNKLKKLPIDDRDARMQMWNTYKDGYMQYYRGAN